MMRWFSHLLCGIRTGHEDVTCFYPTWHLRCRLCGRATRGLVLPMNRPRKRYDGDKARHQIKRSA